ncbi:pyridoxamine 5'-phosphate oxidase family protein [Bordetella petrii]|nr:pyridoxamine 5'-phosphate oxidase family protein [Bordetella petrii]
MDSMIDTVQALEARIGTRPDAVNLKVIDHLDPHAQRWLAASPLAFAGFSDAVRVEVTVAGGAPGFAAAARPGQLRVPRAALDDPRQAQAGRGAGLLFLIPGLGETLRINGVVANAAGPDIVIDVQECYAHCAKALLRSDFWRPDDAAPPDDAAAFVAASRFMALATADAALHTDLSPKGDPAGRLAQCYDGGIRYADRPGNRRTDSLRNLLQRPQAAALLIVPGCARVAELQGAAQISADPGLRQSFTVQDKTPKLVTSLVSPAIDLRDSAALARARPWAAVPPPADIDPAAIFAAHVRLNKTRGLGAAIARGMVSIPGLMRKGLQQDYKRNMY